MPKLSHKYCAREKKIYRLCSVNNLKAKEVTNLITGENEKHLVIINFCLQKKYNDVD